MPALDMPAKSTSSLREHPIVYACIFVKHGVPLISKRERVLELCRSRRRSHSHVYVSSISGGGVGVCRARALLR